MRPSRSALFVPGNRPDWIEKAVGYGADTLILDLEDSVPDREKSAARGIVKTGVQMLKGNGQACAVRINAFATGLTLDDLEAVMCPELDRVLLPKVETPADMLVPRRAGRCSPTTAYSARGPNGARRSSRRPPLTTRARSVAYCPRRRKAFPRLVED